MVRHDRATGFTLVEILVIVTVLMILASASYFFMGGWRERAAVTEVKNDLVGASTALENQRNFSTGYPSSLASSVFTPTATVELNYTRRGDGSYCLNGSSRVSSDVEWYIDSRTNKQLTEGTCAP